MMEAVCSSEMLINTVPTRIHNAIVQKTAISILIALRTQVSPKLTLNMVITCDNYRWLKVPGEEAAERLMLTLMIQTLILIS
jgi:hypothetical protein